MRRLIIADTVQKDTRHKVYGFKDGGHRKYVGGHWQTAGLDQLQFLAQHGLRPNHSFLEIGCGSLRAGRFFIDFLNEDKYCGIDHHRWLIEDGLKMETGMYHWKKNPVFVVDNDFNFGLFNRKFDVVIAKSVLTHLTFARIEHCFNNLKTVLNEGGKFFATVFIGDSKKNRPEDNDTRRFLYSLEEIQDAAKGWKIEDFGILNDLTEQTMLRFSL